MHPKLGVFDVSGVQARPHHARGITVCTYYPSNPTDLVDLVGRNIPGNRKPMNMRPVMVEATLDTTNRNYQTLVRRTRYRAKFAGSCGSARYTATIRPNLAQFKIESSD